MNLELQRRTAIASQSMHDGAVGDYFADPPVRLWFRTLSFQYRPVRGHLLVQSLKPRQRCHSRP
jgi:hypothetical protein